MLIMQQETKIFIQNPEDLKTVNFEELDNMQMFIYKCIICGKEAEKRLYRLQQVNFELLCRGCIKKKHTKPLTAEQKQKINSKREQTNLKKYGTKNPLSNKEIRNKIKKTTLEKYGTESFSKTESFRKAVQKTWSEKSEDDLKEIRLKHKTTCLERYNVEFAAQAETVKESIRQTNMKRYGVAYQQQTAEGKGVRQKTLLKNFGVTNPSKSKEIQEKKKVTNLKRYGTGYVLAAKEIQEKGKETCRRKYGVDNFSQTEAFKQKAKATWQKRLHVENPQQNEQVRLKTKQTCLERYGVENFSQSKEMQQYRRCIYSYENVSFDSKPELAFWIYCKDNNVQIRRNVDALDYVFNNKHHKYFPDFVVNSEFVEIKGDQFIRDDESWCNPFDKEQNALYEAKSLCAKSNNVKIIKASECQQYIDYVDSKYTKDYLNLFRVNLPFPYPNSDLSDTSDYGIIKHFHKSIFKATKKNSLSPFEAWQDKELVRKSALNRLKYVGNCTPEHVVGGFSVARIAPKISVFKPTMAKNLIKKYLNDFSEIVDPFSGFSGRLIGAKNCNKRYIGKDINEEHVKESNEIIQYKNYQDCLVTVEDLLKKEDVEIHECLFTCPPYGGKEHWNENNDEVEKSCDEWIDICLQKYKCKRYLFVVDQTEKYKDKVVEDIGNKNGFFRKKNSELVILIEQ